MTFLSSCTHPHVSLNVNDKEGNVHSALFHSMKVHSIVEGLSNSQKDQAKITYKTYFGVIKSRITHLHVLWL